MSFVLKILLLFTMILLIWAVKTNAEEIPVDGITRSSIQQIINDISSLKRKFSTLEHEMTNLYTGPSSTSNGNEMQTLKDRIAKLEQDNVTAALEIQNLKHTLDITNEKIEKLIQANVTATLEIQTLQQKLEINNEKTEKDIQSLKKKIEQNNATTESKIKVFGHDLQQSTTTYKWKIQALSDDVFAMQQNNKEISNQLSTHEKSIAQQGEITDYLTSNMTNQEYNILQLVSNLTKEKETLANLSQKVNENAKGINDLTNKYKTSNQALASQTQKLSQHTVVNQNQGRGVEQLTQKINDISARLKRTTDSQRQIVNKQAEQSSEISMQATDILIQKQMSLQLQQQITRISSMCNNTKGRRARIGFTAGMTSDVSTGLSVQTLVFPKVIYNSGNGYNSQTGIFTAPVSGDYVFYVSAVSFHNLGIYVDIFVNGQPKVGTYGSTYASYQTGTNLVVYRLQQGDRVWASRWGGNGYSTYPDAPLTTFSGFLL